MQRLHIGLVFGEHFGFGRGAFYLNQYPNFAVFLVAVVNRPVNRIFFVDVIFALIKTVIQKITEVSFLLCLTGGQL